MRTRAAAGLVLAGWALLSPASAEEPGTAFAAVAAARPAADPLERELRQRIEEAASRAASAQVAAPDRFETLSVRFGGSDPLPAGALDLRVAEVLGPTASGTQRVRFVALVDGVPAGLAWATVRGVVRGPVLEARRVLPGGQPIAADAVELVDADLSRLTGDPVRDMRELEGLVPVRTLGEGRAVTRDLLRAPPVVRRGDTVELLVRRAGLVVTAKGTVQRDGAPGETVPARNLDTGAELVGRVQADGSLLVVGAASRRGRS